MGAGPHTSEWMSCNGAVVVQVDLTKGSLVRLPNWHSGHKRVGLLEPKTFNWWWETRCRRAWGEGCPRRLCQVVEDADVKKTNGVDDEDFLRRIGKRLPLKGPWKRTFPDGRSLTVQEVGVKINAQSLSEINYVKFEAHVKHYLYEIEKWT